MSKATDIHKNNVLIGAGELYLDRLDENDMPTGERFLGDGVSASLSVTTERTQVFSGTGPVAEKLVDAVRSIDRAITIAVRDMSHENLALFVGAPEVGDVSDVSAAVTDEALTVRQARWYQLGAAKEKPMGVGAVSATAADTVRETQPVSSSAAPVPVSTLPAMRVNRPPPRAHSVSTLSNWESGESPR